MRKVLLSFLLSVFIALPAKAALLVEPQFNMSLAGDIGSGPNSDLKSFGSGYGARIGYQSLGFMLGFDYQSMSEKQDNAARTSVDTREMGVFIGYNLPVMLRFYGGYILDGKLEHGTTNYDKGASGYKLGVGWTGLPFLSVNLEYKSYEFESRTAIQDLDYKSTVLAISLPFTL